MVWQGLVFFEFFEHPALFKSSEGISEFFPPISVQSPNAEHLNLIFSHCIFFFTFFLLDAAGASGAIFLIFLIFLESQLNFKFTLGINSLKLVASDFLHKLFLNILVFGSPKWVVHQLKIYIYEVYHDRQKINSLFPLNHKLGLFITPLNISLLWQKLGERNNFDDAGTYKSIKSDILLEIFPIVECFDGEFKSGHLYAKMFLSLKKNY